MVICKLDEKWIEMVISFDFFLLHGLGWCHIMTLGTKISWENLSNWQPFQVSTFSTSEQVDIGKIIIEQKQ